MIDLANDEKRGRLYKAIRSSRDALEPFRRVRKELIKDYVTCDDWTGKSLKQPHHAIGWMIGQGAQSFMMFPDYVGKTRGKKDGVWIVRETEVRN